MPVAHERSSAPGGLTSAEAAARLARVGPNALPAPAPEPLWRRFARQFASPVIYILLVALAVDVAAWAGGLQEGRPLEAAAIAVILALNAGLGVWQERKAEHALARLRSLAAPRVSVWRDGVVRSLAARDLVPDDVVQITAGDRVPADAVVLEGRNLLVDESVVTGESAPVERGPDDELHAGTLAVRGSARVAVTRTGPRSAMGRLAVMLGDIQAEPTPLERRMRAFGTRVARWVLALALALMLAGIAAEGIGRLGQVFVFAVALAVAAVPEGLPAVLTVTLALGVERMARRQAVVRRLAAVEALGSVTVIVTDKTGTLTENRMEVRGLEVVDEARATRAMVLASEAEPAAEIGDPIEIALLAHAARGGTDTAAMRRAHPRVGGRPFDSAWKFARAAVREDGAVRSYLKGAPEVLLARTTLDAAARADWAGRIARYAAEGYRLLGLATAAGEAERDLEWLGLVLLWDPPRAEVPNAVRRARAAGIRVVMATGDHPETAATIARTIGMDAAPIATGAELATADDERLATTSVFARVAPEDKLRLVETLQRRGEIVAMTGDGVNDAPALKRADVGVAMGRRGSDVTREVADLVLLDDDFATIVAAIEEGRGIYENIQAFVRFLFSTNLAEVTLVTVGTVLAFLLDLRDDLGAVLLPLTAAQLLWINMVTDGAPALALATTRTPGVMDRPPRPPDAPLLDPPSRRFVAGAGATVAVIGFLLLGLPPVAGVPLIETRTAVFVFIAVAQLIVAYPACRVRATARPGPWLHVAVAGSVVAQLAVVTVPALRVVFDAAPLSAAAWGMVVAAVGATAATIHVAQRWTRRAAAVRA
jgi:Ca2+-transporting ATPase